MRCNMDKGKNSPSQSNKGYRISDFDSYCSFKGKSSVFNQNTDFFKGFFSLRGLKLGSVSQKLHLPCCNILKIPGTSGLESKAWGRLMMTWKMTGIYPP